LGRVYIALQVDRFPDPGASLVSRLSYKYKSDVMGESMTDEKTCWESFKADGSAIVEKIKDLIRAGNVRRVMIEHEGRTVADFPLTVGVVGVVLAPVAAALGTLVALLQDCTIHVERVRSQSGEPSEAPASE